MFVVLTADPSRTRPNPPLVTSPLKHITLHVEANLIYLNIFFIINRKFNSK